MVPPLLASLFPPASVLMLHGIDHAREKNSILWRANLLFGFNLASGTDSPSWRFAAPLGPLRRFLFYQQLARRLK